MNVIAPLITLLLLYLAVLSGLLVWALHTRKKIIGSRKVAILASSIPPTVPGMVNVFLFLLLHQDISNLAAIAALSLIGAGVLTFVGLFITRRSDIAKGLGIGTGIAIVVCILELILPNLLFPSVFPSS
jgi:hypothetical protein